MSCGDGNRFVCGIRRYEKHRNSVADKPSNAILHNENNKRLEELIAQRSLQDRGVFSYPPIPQIQYQQQQQQWQQPRPPFHQSASNIIQNVPSNSFSLSTPSLNSQKQQQQYQHQKRSISNEITDVTKGERVIDFDTYLNVD